MLTCNNLMCGCIEHAKLLNNYAKDIGQCCVDAASSAIPLTCPKTVIKRSWLDRVQQKSLFLATSSLNISTRDIFATRDSRYQKKHSTSYTYPDHESSFTCFLHLLWLVASSLFNLRSWQSFCKTSLQVLFGLPLDLTHSTSYCLHFFTQSLTSFHNACPYECNLDCCSTDIISCILNLFCNSLLETLSITLTPHIHLTILISARWCATSFSFLTGRSHFHATYYFTHNCCTVYLSLIINYILIGKQWYKLPELIPSNSNSVLHSCISISVYTQHVT